MILIVIRQRLISLNSYTKYRMYKKPFYARSNGEFCPFWCKGLFLSISFHLYLNKNETQPHNVANRYEYYKNHLQD